MAAHREDASWRRPDHKVLTLKLPLETSETGNEQLHAMVALNSNPSATVSQDTFDELARKYRSLSETNASLRQEYDAMVQEKSASLSSLRLQLMSFAQQELDDCLRSDLAASDAIQNEELCRLRDSVDFLQNENAATKDALKESEERVAERANEVKELTLRLTGFQDSLLVYEQSLSDSHAKLQREIELCSLLRQSLKDSEEKRQVSDALLISKTQQHQIQLLDLLAASSVAESSLQNELVAQRAQNDQLQEKHQSLETTLAAQQDQNRQLQEKYQSMESELAAQQDQSRQLHTNNQSLENELAAQRAQNDQLQEKHQSLDTKLEAQQDQNRQLKTNNQSLENELAAQRAQNDQLQEKHHSLETTLAAQQDQNRQLQEKYQSMEAELAAQQDQNRQLHINNQSLENELAAQRAQTDQLQEKHQSLDTKLASMEAELAAQQDQSRQLQEKHLAHVSTLLAEERDRHHQLKQQHSSALQITLEEFEGSLCTATSEFQLRLRSSKMFASEYVANCLDSLRFAVVALSFWKWKFVLAEASKSPNGRISTSSLATQTAISAFEGRELELARRAAVPGASMEDGVAATRAAVGTSGRHSAGASSATAGSSLEVRERTPARQSAVLGDSGTDSATAFVPFQLVSDEPFQLKSALSPFPDRQGSGDLVASSDRITPTSHTSSKNVHLTTSDALQLLDEVCAELSSVSNDLHSLASDLQSLITSAATALNASLSESSMRPMSDLHQAHAAYLSSLSQCEARLHDVNVPLVTCTQSLRDALTSLSMAPHAMSHSAVELSSLLDLPSQLSDASLAIERAVRNTEASSIELRTLLLSPSVAETGHSNTSLSYNLPHFSTSRMASERSSFNRVLGSVLSCQSRIALCANVASACLGDLSRTRILRIRTISNRANVKVAPNVKL
jgi:hypothetical protein